MKIPKQSKPVRRAGFMNRLNVKGINTVTPSMVDDESEDIPDMEDEGGESDMDEGGEEAFEGGGEEAE